MLEYCQNSDLFEFISKYVVRQNAEGMANKQGQGLIVRDYKLMQSICFQLVQGLEQMHNKG